MEGVLSGRRPGQEHSGRSGCSHRKHERIYSEGNLAIEEKGEAWHPYERQRKKTKKTEEGSHSKRVIARQSQVARSSRHKWNSLPRYHKKNEQLEGKVRGRSSLTQERRKDKLDFTRAGHRDRGGFAHTPSQLKDRRTLPRSPKKTTGPRCCQNSADCRSVSLKCRRQHLSSEACESLAVFTSKLFNQVSALQVVLDELRAPGGAFLRVSAGDAQPRASQRAWLSWQLAHTGANLHWALAELDALIAPRPVLTPQRPCMPGAHLAVAPVSSPRPFGPRANPDSVLSVPFPPTAQLKSAGAGNTPGHGPTFCS